MGQQKASKLKSVRTFLRRQEKIVRLIIVVATLTLAVSGAVSIMLDKNTVVSLPSVANIRSVGLRIYWDADLQNETTRIDWGTIYLGFSYNVTLYLESTSNVPTTLVLLVTNWTLVNRKNRIVSGPAETTPHIDLTWNYDNQTLNPGQTIQTTLTLTTDSSPDFAKYMVENDVMRFTMDMTIQAREK